MDSNAIDFTDAGINFVGRTFENNGIQGKIQKRDFEPNEPYTITATVIGNYKYVKFQTEEYYCSQNINKLSPKVVVEKWNERIAYFIVANVQKFVSLYDGQQGGYKLEDIKQHKIKLPLRNGKIDFDFMESFIAELEAERVAELSAYLTVSRLDNYELSEEELRVLRDYDNGDIQLKEFKFSNIFNKIVQGRRLKKDDQLPGKIPFVMSGVTNNGVVGYISNPVASFRKNAITVDIFGNSFYRDYDFGAGDDTGVYWSDKVEYSKLTMLYFTAAIQRALLGRFSYGKKLRSSQSYNFVMKLPYKNNEPDFDTMNILISAIQKMVIKDVVKYSDDKINATKM